MGNRQLSAPVGVMETRYLTIIRELSLLIVGGGPEDFWGATKFFPEILGGHQFFFRNFGGLSNFFPKFWGAIKFFSEILGGYQIIFRNFGGPPNFFVHISKKNSNPLLRL